MAKRLIKPDGLWTPPHLRRGPERPPTGRRFVNRRCCCTVGGGDVCADCPESFAVDLGVGGWVDAPCFICDDFNGVVVADSFSLCIWLYTLTPFCEGAVAVQLFDPDTTASFFRVQMEVVASLIPVRRSDVQWSSSTWDAVANPTCLHLADGGGKITLTKDSESHTGGATCTGTMPATITIEDAAP